MGFWFDATAHVLLPRACAHCRGDLPFRRDDPLCAPCEDSLPPPPSPACARCAAALRGGRTHCGHCAGRLYACRVVRAGVAYRGAAASLVHAFKFRGSRSAARSAGSYLAGRLNLHPEIADFDAVVPVPLHHRRERERGYNQAEILAREIAARCGRPMLLPLVRRRASRPSWSLGRADRRSELTGAFDLSPGAGKTVVGKRCLLVDDVCATGTTLDECAYALRRGGAADVAAFVFARAGKFI